MNIVFALFYSASEQIFCNQKEKKGYGNYLFYPFWELKQRLGSQGHNVVSRKEFDIFKADIAVFYDIDEKLYELALSLPAGTKKILLCFESPIYTPVAHHAAILNRGHWDAVITYNRSFTGNKIHHIDIPVAGKQVTPVYPTETKQDDCGVIVASYKGDIRGETHLRDTLLKRLAAEKRIHIYGIGWKKADNIFGQVEDKIATMSQYSYALSFENSVYPGYVTEKLGDAVLAGLPSIYYGDWENAERRFPGVFIPLTKLDFEHFMNAKDELEQRHGELLENVRHCQAASDGWMDSFLDTFIAIVNKFQERS